MKLWMISIAMFLLTGNVFAQRVPMHAVREANLKPNDSQPKLRSTASEKNTPVKARKPNQDSENQKQK